MKNTTKKLSNWQPIPLLKQESLYIGIDIGKERHVAGFVSLTLLERHQRFEACPALAFENSRDGFHTLGERIRALAPFEHCFALLEKTGHYHKALVQYLQELDNAKSRSLPNSTRFTPCCTHSVHTHKEEAFFAFAL
ncbi:hypothetical protein [Dictyobacter formicarum]|uniref:Transposase IS111A/IS1328/IS1533 N-terminal domain-containing protein n=1 Tax=Dictyobacter formicarum TaxID=2778368 RepID=A0ABQ3VXL8_9CHLR|nr:hypothetical protein [Dictyobacter formicarum]GHO89791.1 hypothetical protein KSZ_77970 [Dictyobacter formicarum]